MDLSTAMKRTTNSSTQLIPASKPVKPLQTHASSNGVKDAKMAAMLASLRAEIDQLKKLQAAKPIEKKLEEIARPSKIMNLQHTMGLADDKKLYSHCRSTVQDVVAHAGLPSGVDWRLQDVVAVGKVAQVAISRNKHLRRYKGNWATLEIMKLMLKNQRCYKQRITSSDQYNQDDGEELEEGPRSIPFYLSTSLLNTQVSVLLLLFRKLYYPLHDEGEKESESEKEGNDSDWDSMYMPERIGKEDGNENEGGHNVDGDDIEEFGRNEDDGNGMDGDDIEEFGRKDDEGRNGEGSCSIEQAAATGLARTKKRKVTHNDKPATTTTTRAAGKRKKVDSSGGDQVASRSAPLTKRALLKRKYSKKKD
ncbi:hypothetical protein BYT27DRAFT_7340269 [Phlegmacium glaucopus]|nr:hypothetical protein BYT27DRAFT_7340269 [Phlegmacium glaucopus]